MPNGVICGGALDGSSQVGEIVTCHAMTARPADSFSAARDAAALNARSAKLSVPANAGRQRRICNDVIQILPAARAPRYSRTSPTPGTSARIISRGKGLSAILVTSGNPVRPRPHAALGWQPLPRGSARALHRDSVEDLADPGREVGGPVGLRDHRKILDPSVVGSGVGLPGIAGGHQHL